MNDTSKTQKLRPVINVADVALRDQSNGDKFQAKVGSFGRTIGSTGIGVMLHVVEPGKRAYPFHNHHVTEELFVVLEGTGTYRFGKDSYPIRAGDVCAAPAGGQENAHQIINTGTAPLKYLGISSSGGARTELVEYPDSGKIGITSRYDWNTKQGLRTIVRPGQSLDYWDGE
jgi:uncharacterized cupin superfamily protein